MSLTKISFILIATAIFSCELHESAASIIKMDAKDLAIKSDCIITGKVIGMRSAWDKKHTTINTHVKIAVEDCIKGKKKGNITVKVPGGKVEETEIGTPSAPRFTAAERVLVFLCKDGLSEYKVIGGFQGKYSISDGNVQGKDMTLGAFVAEIRSALQNR